MLLAPDPFDPNFLDFGQDHACYIYGDDYGHVAARVDVEDYQFFYRWRWAVKPDKRGRKLYLYRTVTDRTRATKFSLFLHVSSTCSTRRRR